MYNVKYIIIYNVKYYLTIHINFCKSVKLYMLSATHHSDPLGPPAERPRTGMPDIFPYHDSDDDEINTNSLLPI